MTKYPHIVGIHWAAHCMMEWYIILEATIIISTLTYTFYYTFYQIECISTPNL